MKYDDFLKELDKGKKFSFTDTSQDKIHRYKSRVTEDPWFIGKGLDDTAHAWGFMVQIHTDLINLGTVYTFIPYKKEDD